MRVADTLVDTGSAMSMLSAAMYARLPDSPAIHPFLRAAPEVVGVGDASAVIRGYVTVPVKFAGVAVRHPLLVVEGLAFPLIIGTDILRANRLVLTLDESEPGRLRVRVCAVCGEQRTASTAEPSSSTRTGPFAHSTARRASISFPSVAFAICSYASVYSAVRPAAKEETAPQ